VAKHDYSENADPQHHYIWHYGSVRLADVIADGNYSGVKAEAAHDYYKPYIYVDENQNGELSIIYSYLPVWEQIQERLDIKDFDITIPVDVLLTRQDGKSAAITINMIYTESLFLKIIPKEDI